MATKQSRDVAERRSRVEEMRKAQQAKQRRITALLSVGGGIVVLALIAAIVVFAVNRHQKEVSQVLPAAVESPTDTTTQKALISIPDTSGIDGVKAYDTTSSTDTTVSPTDPTNKGIEHTHVYGPVTYAITPPVGGPHNPTWMNAGYYTSPVVTERAVHLLEHGVVWITYQPTLPAAQVETLKKLFESTGNASIQGTDLKSKYLLVSPWGGSALPSPIVISAWGRQLAVTDASDPRLAKFIATFRVDQANTYEAGAQDNGVPVSTGGRPDET